MVDKRKKGCFILYPARFGFVHGRKEFGQYGGKTKITEKGNVRIRECLFMPALSSFPGSLNDVIICNSYISLCFIFEADR
jgi:hypothetical protein